MPYRATLTDWHLIRRAESHRLLTCSSPDRPRHRLHANCRGVAGLRRPCLLTEEGGREVVLCSFWWGALVGALLSSRPCSVETAESDHSLVEYHSESLEVVLCLSDIMWEGQQLRVTFFRH